MAAAGGYFVYHAIDANSGHANHVADDGVSSSSPSAVRVQVVKPERGGMDRTTSQPGTIISYESVPLYAAVSGYLKTLFVDIGSEVKEGDVLAEIDVPEFVLQLERHEAGIEQAKARVAQMQAAFKVSEADLITMEANIKQAEAAAKSAKAWKRFREKQFNRMQELLTLKSVDDRLVDESQERFEAATEALRSAEETVSSSKARKIATQAKMLQCEADILEARAGVKVAEAEARKSKQMVDYAVIRAPFDGIVTQRTVFPKQLIRAANQNASALPLFTVEKVDKMRVVVHVPDRDVPYADIGDSAIVEIDALPGKAVEGKISRIAGSEDPQTRLMRVEIDVPNPARRIRQGMYGKVTIILERGLDVLSVPSHCLVGKTQKDQGKVFVVRAGKAVLTTVTIGADNGLRVGILKGLGPNDLVITRPGSTIVDNSPVTISPLKKG